MHIIAKSTSVDYTTDNENENDMTQSIDNICNMNLKLKVFYDQNGLMKIILIIQID